MSVSARGRKRSVTVSRPVSRRGVGGAPGSGSVRPMGGASRRPRARALANRFPRCGAHTFGASQRPPASIADSRDHRLSHHFPSGVTEPTEQLPVLKEYGRSIWPDGIAGSKQARDVLIAMLANRRFCITNNLKEERRMPPLNGDDGIPSGFTPNRPFGVWGDSGDAGLIGGGNGVVASSRQGSGVAGFTLQTATPRFAAGVFGSGLVGVAGLVTGDATYPEKNVVVYGAG